ARAAGGSAGPPPRGAPPGAPNGAPRRPPAGGAAPPRADRRGVGTPRLGEIAQRLDRITDRAGTALYVRSVSEVREFAGHTDEPSGILRNTCGRTRRYEPSTRGVAASCF